MPALNFDRHCLTASQKDRPLCTPTNYERKPFVHILINNGYCLLFFLFLFFLILAEMIGKSMVLILICIYQTSSKLDHFYSFTMGTMKDKVERVVLMYFF